MAISQVALSPGTAASEVASNKLAENFDTFLQLLTTQLQHQDPLSPMESNEFVAQLVQFSEVEQAIASNKSLEKLIDLQNTNQATAAISYIGQTIEAAGTAAPLQNGGAQYSYTLDDNAAATALVITDALGQVVFSTPGETSTGRHDFTWNGQDANGNQLPEGIYHLNVSAQNSDSELVNTSTTAFGRVTGVESGPEGVMLSLSGAQVPIGSVLSIKEPANPSEG